MTKILPLNTEIEDLKSELIMSLELQRGEGCDVDAIREVSEKLADAMRPVLGAAVVRPGGEEFETTFSALENAYRDWKSINSTMAETLNLAYNNSVPRSNLLLDEVLNSLRTKIGEPISARYTQMREQWREHISERPWDAYITRTPVHLDDEELNKSLTALVRGDDLDVEDAVGDLTGSLRYAFVDFLRTNPNEMDDLEIGLWKRPEFIIANDFWGHASRMKLIDVFKTHGSKRFTNAMSTLDNLFSTSPKDAASVVSSLKDAPEAYRERLTRCLMLHPDHEVRRYAVNNASEGSIWKVLTPANVPCATILTVLEHIVGSNQFSNQHRRIFFDTVYRRLLSVSSRSDVLYARGIVRILTRLNFFLEDHYFTRLMTLLDYLDAKERYHNIDDVTMASHIERLRAEKEKAGSIPMEEPDFTGVPLVILRKLARDGHFWYLLSMHPIVKIAKETISSINTREHAHRAALNHRINPEVIRVIGRRRSLFATLQSQLALLSNPKTPPLTSVEYIADLTSKDIELLLRRQGIHPELRTRLRNRYNSWKR